MQTHNNDTTKITDPLQLTPIETHQVNGNSIYFKRDDYLTLTDIPLSGGKLRQCYSLLSNLKETIQTHHNNTIATATSVNSPQGIIVSAVAHHLGMNTIIGVGGKVDFNKHPMLMYAHKYFNTDLRILSGIAYTSQLHSEFLKQQTKEHFYIVKFGINLETHSDAILDSIALQAKNLPQDIDNLIIPTGSGITGAGILLGIHKYINKQHKPKNIIILQIAGNDRRQDINRILAQELGMIDYKRIKYTYIADKTYPYSKHIKITDPIPLDPVYEAKAYEYALKNNLLTDKSLFWVVGNSQPIRDYCRNHI